MIVGPQDILNYSEGVLVVILQTTYCHLYVPHAINCSPAANHMHAMYTHPSNMKHNACTLCMCVHVCTLLLV